MKKTQEQIWEGIANSWNERRNRPLKETIEFLKDKKGNILDLCCGSGRNFCKIEGKLYGVDFSEKMLEYAEEKAKKLGIECEFIKANADKLPFEYNFFDAAIFIGGLHCIESKENRERALKELFRVLALGGRVLIMVWCKNNKRIKGRTGEMIIPWSAGGKKYQRFSYIYESEELKRLLRNIGFKIIKTEENENIVVEIEK